MADIDSSTYPIITTPAGAFYFLGYDAGADDPANRITDTSLKALFQSEANTAGKAPQRDADGVVSVSGVRFYTSGAPSTPQQGDAWWDAAAVALQYAVSSTETVTIGQEMTPRYRNSTGSTLANMTAVYIAGSTGTNINIAKAKADTLATAQPMIGLVTDAAGIANGASGRVCVFGLVNDVDTSAFSAGDTLYLSAATAGGVTNVKPSTAGQFVVRVGFVQRAHATQGSILVAPHYHGSVTGDAVMNATSAEVARSALGAAGVDVAVYGASPSASAAINYLAISTALADAGLVFISKPGTYQFSNTLVLKSKTTLVLAANVTLDYTGSNYSAIRNEGALTGSVDTDITILGYGAWLKVSGSSASVQDIPGMNGHINFFNARRVVVDGLSCNTLGASRFYSQFCEVKNWSAKRLYVTGSGSIVKDAVKVSGGCEDWDVTDCYFATTDDCISACPWDYAHLTPRNAPIRRGLIDRCEFGTPSGGAAAGYIRFLPSAWAAWGNGSSYTIADTANNGGYQYRKTNSGTATASVAPTHTTLGQKVTGADGIEWMCAGACTFTKSEVTDITVRDLTISSASNHALFATNNDSNGRSIYPGQSSSGLLRNIVFSRVRFNRPVAENAPLALVGLAVDGLVAEDVALESGKLPSALFQLNAAAGRLIIRRLNAPTWRNSASVGFVQLSTGGSFTSLLVEDCVVTGLNDGTNFQSSDGILVFGGQANALGDIEVRGGRYDWLPSLVRVAADGGVKLTVRDAVFDKVRRLMVATSGTGASVLRIRGNRFKQAPTLGLWGSTVSGQTIAAHVSGNDFDAASTLVADTGGASRILFSDAPAVTASLAGAAAGDLVRTSSGWQEYNGSAWGAVRN